MKCVVCAEREAPFSMLCCQCQRSLRHLDFSRGAIIEWAANRARRFERARARAANDPARRRVREALEAAGIDPERFVSEWCRAHDEHEAEEAARAMERAR